MWTVFNICSIEMPSTELLCNVLGSNSINSKDSSVLGFYSVLMGKRLLEFWRSSAFIFNVKQSKLFFQYAANYCLLKKKIPEALDCPIMYHFCYIISYSTTLSLSIFFKSGSVFQFWFLL